MGGYSERDGGAVVEVLVVVGLGQAYYEVGICMKIGITQLKVDGVSLKRKLFPAGVKGMNAAGIGVAGVGDAIAAEIEEKAKVVNLSG